MGPSYRRLAALFVLGVLAFLSPVLGAANRPGSVGGFPLLPAYLFGAWAAVVVGAWATTRRRKP